MIQLPKVQAHTLRIIFEEQFDENEIYLEHVEIDEIFNVLIGGEMEFSFYERLESSICVDEFNHGFMVMISEYIETIELSSVVIEFYELAHNCKKLNDKIKKIIKDYE